jgi:hypothetical protein
MLNYLRVIEDTDEDEIQPAQLTVACDHRDGTIRLWIRDEIECRISKHEALRLVLMLINHLHRLRARQP